MVKIRIMTTVEVREDSGDYKQVEADCTIHREINNSTPLGTLAQFIQDMAQESIKATLAGLHEPVPEIANERSAT